MFSGRFSFRRGEEDTTLAADLKRVTESNVLQVPKDLLTMVVEATRLGEKDRREIMMHLRECLAEPQGKEWRRMYAGLVLTEELLTFAAPELLTETAEGRYFDLVQRLSLLEHFECTNDLRVQNMVRTKATALRAEAVSKLESAADGSWQKSNSPENSSNGSFSTTASSSKYSSNTDGLPEKQMILNGVVAVGHNEDTDSESDNDADAPRKAVAYRDVKKPAVSNGAPVRSNVASASSADIDLLNL
jgi:hypothetical protein